jgi:hypothetical protein
MKYTGACRTDFTRSPPAAQANLSLACACDAVIFQRRVTAADADAAATVWMHEAGLVPPATAADTPPADGPHGEH